MVISVGNLRVGEGGCGHADGVTIGMHPVEIVILFGHSGEEKIPQFARAKICARARFLLARL